MGLALATLTSSLIYFGRVFIASFFTNIDDHKEILVSTFELVAFVEFFSCCQIWNQGFLKGLGKFNQAINALLLSFYVIALPLGVYLAFWQFMGIKGLWTGMLIGLIVLNCLLLYLAWRHYSWEEVIKES